MTMARPVHSPETTPPHKGHTLFAKTPSRALQSVHQRTAPIRGLSQASIHLLRVSLTLLMLGKAVPLDIGALNRSSLSSNNPLSETCVKFRGSALSRVLISRLIWYR